MFELVISLTASLAGVFGGVVAALAHLKIYDLWRQGECSDRMWLIWGVGLVAAGYALNRVWAVVWRLGESYGYDTAWMTSHWALVLFNVISGFGYLLHIRTLTWEWPWPEWTKTPWRILDRAVRCASGFVRRFGREV